MYILKNAVVILELLVFTVMLWTYKSFGGRASHVCCFSKEINIYYITCKPFFFQESQPYHYVVGNDY